MALSSANKQLIRSASRIYIIRCIDNVQGYWANGQWLSERNKYVRDCIAQIAKESPSNSAWRPTHIHLAEYIAVSSIVHCFDGWSYIGRAIEAELAGDPDAARHLGYYAELRATMSLLASEGIGVFNNKHVVVDANGRCHCLRGPGTHTFAWEALSEWADSPAGVDNLQRSITPGGVVLSEWLAQFSTGANFLSSSWLRQWGIDLARISDDKSARNIASYRPTAFTSAGPAPVVDTVSALTDLWDMLEPRETGGFPILDRHLLRLGLELAFRNSHAYRRTWKQAKKMYENQVTLMLSGISPADLSPSQWADFLKYAGPRQPQTILNAMGTDSASHIDHSKQVIARACLLLRVATGSVSELAGAAPVDLPANLKFWLFGDSVRRRLWARQAPPDSFADLWRDIADAANNIQSWLDGHSDPSLYSLWQERASDASSLASTERAALWGLCA